MNNKQKQRNSRINLFIILFIFVLFIISCDIFFLSIFFGGERWTFHPLLVFFQPELFPSSFHSLYFFQQIVVLFVECLLLTRILKGTIQEKTLRSFLKEWYFYIFLIFAIAFLYPLSNLLTSIYGGLFFLLYLKNIEKKEKDIKHGYKAGLISGGIYGMINAIIIGFLQWIMIYIYHYEISLTWMRYSIPVLMLLAMTGGVIGGIFFAVIFALKYEKIPTKTSKKKGIIISLLFWLIFQVGLSYWNIRFKNVLFFCLTISIGLVLTLFWGYLLVFFWEKFTSKADPNLVDNKTLRRDGDLQEE